MLDQVDKATASLRQQLTVPRPWARDDTDPFAE